MASLATSESLWSGTPLAIFRVGFRARATGSGRHVGTARRDGETLRVFHCGTGRLRRVASTSQAM